MAKSRSFHQLFNVPKGFDAKIIRKLFTKFELTGRVFDDRVGNVGPNQNEVTPENITTGFWNCSAKSIRRIALEIDLKHFQYAENIQKQPTHVFMQNPKSSSRTHKSCVTKG
ncbi:DUF4817 domain-containing protein [Nephila pilipes]|uniref:DUF4817 domain-containing protein n=1 Tax=Nephila pilipes TaxID=299642 RepID=A0A8X6P9E5_NEPPI|nr:DUF4817 domain-containing protein [Nephila pilipes]